MQQEINNSYRVCKRGLAEGGMKDEEFVKEN